MAKNRHATQKIATAEHIAALGFEPWTPADNEAALKLAQQFIDALRLREPAIRMAILTMCKTKGELEEIARSDDGSDHSPVRTLVNSLQDAGAIFKDAGSLLIGAECRVMSAYASALKSDDPEGFAEA